MSEQEERGLSNQALRSRPPAMDQVSPAQSRASSRTLSLENPLIHDQVAQVAHAANSAICEVLGMPVAPSWHELPEEHRTLVRNGVKFQIDNPNATPADAHANWVAMKRVQGWEHGPALDMEKKQHPCIVPYDSLPPNQTVKDHVFQAICHACFQL